MRSKGKITNWDDDKGFGFIIPKRGGNKIFVHIKSFSNRKRRPLENEVVSYKLKLDPKGKAQAESVKFKWGRMHSVMTFTHRNIALIFIITFLTFLTAAGYFAKLPYIVLWFYLSISVVTFVAYALDKSAAKKDKWRTKEKTLHIFSIIGGWPGALAAQQLIRHKSSKRPFKMIFWITVILNCGALSLLFTSVGSETLRTVLSVIKIH